MSRTPATETEASTDEGTGAEPDADALSPAMAQQLRRWPSSSRAAWSNASVA